MRRRIYASFTTPNTWLCMLSNLIYVFGKQDWSLVIEYNSKKTDPFNYNNQSNWFYICLCNGPYPRCVNLWLNGTRYICTLWTTNILIYPYKTKASWVYRNTWHIWIILLYYAIWQCHEKVYFCNALYINIQGANAKANLNIKKDKEDIAQYSYEIYNVYKYLILNHKWKIFYHRSSRGKTKKKKIKFHKN